MAPPLPTAAVRTIADLITSNLWIAAGEPLRAVARAWAGDPEAEGLAVLEGPRARYLSRARFLLHMKARPAAADVRDDPPVSSLSEDGTTVEAAMDPVEVLALAMQRDAEKIADDVIVMDSGRFRGLVSMRALLVHHRRLLLDGIAGGARFHRENQELGALVHTQSGLLRGLVQELRGPAEALLGIARAIEASGSARPLERVRRMVDLGQQMLSTLDELPGLSGLERSDIGVVPQVVDPRPLIADMVVGGTSAGGAVPFEARFDDLPPSFVTDPILLRAVVAGLVGVGRRLKGDADVKLRVSRAGRDLVFEIRHSGTGSNGEGLPHLLAEATAPRERRAESAGGAAVRLAALLRVVQVLGASVAAGQDEDATTLAVRVPPSP